MKKALTIAGSDNSGGAGIQADLKVFKEHGIFGLSAITSITSQNSKGVQKTYPVPPEILKSQIQSILEDTKINAVKIGMILTKENVDIISSIISKYKLKNIVLDTVIKSSSGKFLLEKKAWENLKKNLIPLTDIITPNKDEAESLTGLKIKNTADMEEVCKLLYENGAKNVYLKGGHIDFKDKVLDIFYNGKKFAYLEYPKVKIKKGIHGTGCVLSSAIASNLALGYSVEKSVKISRAYIQNKIETSFKFGKGYFYMKL